jgi:hypothetical protein
LWREIIRGSTTKRKDRITEKSERKARRRETGSESRAESRAKQLKRREQT